MATYDLTAAGGTTGHPANGRTPYLVENTIDVSAINSDSGASQNDVLRALDIPAETLIMEAGIEVITALSSSVTLDLGITGGDVDRYVDGDTNATGFSAPTATAGGGQAPTQPDPWQEYLQNLTEPSFAIGLPTSFVDLPSMTPYHTDSPERHKDKHPF